MITVITPWLNAGELIPTYEAGVAGAQVIVVDNGSSPDVAAALHAMCERLSGVYIRNDSNVGFARANNQGMAHADGERVVCLNNDVDCRPGWLEQVERDVQPGALYGPSLLERGGLPYIEGWCIAGMLTDWLALGGWDDEYYAGLYWEDNDLCFRAVRMGLGLIRVHWPVWHYGNYTSARTPGAYDAAAENERRFWERVRSWQR